MTYRLVFGVLIGNLSYGMYPKITFIRYGGKFEDWTEEGTDYVACPDGIRPVVFKLEKISEE